MLLGTLTLGSLLLVAGSPPADVWYTNQRNIKIPISIKEESRREIRELILYASNDQGKTWHQEAVVTPDRDGFAFYAPVDGLYWFSVGTVDLKGVQYPADIYKASADLRVQKV